MGAENRRCTALTLSKLLITIHIRHAYWIEPPLVVVPSPLVYCESACATERSCAWSVYLTGTSLHLWWYQLLWYIVNLPVPLRDYRPSVTTTNILDMTGQAQSANLPMRQHLVGFRASSPAIRRITGKNFEAIETLRDRQLHSGFSTRATVNLSHAHSHIPIAALRHILAQHSRPLGSEDRPPYLS
jgi:hypothetical protein